MKRNILEYLEATVTKVPNKIAFADDSYTATFKEVYNNARIMGTILYNEGYRREPIVVFMKKSPRAIISFLGTIYSGCYYVPIDEEMPKHRIHMILANLNPKAIITDKQTRNIITEFNFEFHGNIYTYEEMIKESLDEGILNEIRNKSLDIDPMYVVFTSGSTGMPKGVVACHRSVIDYAESLSEVLKFDEESIFGNQAPLYFDACLKEIMPTLMFGATTYLIPKKLFISPIKLVEFLNEYKINTACWVVSGFTIISSLGVLEKIKPKYLRTIAFVSEVFPVKQFNIWKENCPNIEFTNLYGPTEVTGICCYYKVERKFDLNEVIPIGKPFKNTGILLLDENNKEVPDGQVGEIYVRGTCLTLGYYNDPIRTKEVFVKNPLNKVYDETIYKTGDLARYNEKGELIFIGRKDTQIKHMGHRIELGEIEAITSSIDEIRSNCCLFDSKKKKIVLIYAGKVDKNHVICNLKDKLPRYMIPNKIIKLDNIPLTANGKIDRRLLKEEFVN